MIFLIQDLLLNHFPQVQDTQSLSFICSLQKKKKNRQEAVMLLYSLFVFFLIRKQKLLAHKKNERRPSSQVEVPGIAASKVFREV